MGDGSQGLCLGVEAFEKEVVGKETIGHRRGQIPVVLLHAFPLDSRMWWPLVRELAHRGIVAYGFDTPGFGVTSPWLDITPSIDAIADAAVATLNRLGVSSAYWVGCSMGGYVALAAAERHPTAVAGLVLIDTRSGSDTEEKRQERLRSAEEIEHTGRLVDPNGWAKPLIGIEGEKRVEIVATVAGMIASAVPTAVAWGLRAMAGRPDRTAVLEGFDRPAAVVWGERDIVSGFHEADVMAKALGVEVARIPGVGHLSPLEAPIAVADVLAGLDPH